MMSLVGDERCNLIHNTVLSIVLVGLVMTAITLLCIQGRPCWSIIAVISHDVVEGLLCDRHSVDGSTGPEDCLSTPVLWLRQLVVASLYSCCCGCPVLSCCRSAVGVVSNTPARRNGRLHGKQPIRSLFHMLGNQGSEVNLEKIAPVCWQHIQVKL